MFQRMQAAIARVIGRDRSADRLRMPGPVDVGESAEIDFRSLDPGIVSDGSSGSALICPVTRLELKPNDVVYQCRACLTSYSKAGWEFMRDVNRGRCCACGLSKTVCPLL